MNNKGTKLYEQKERGKSQNKLKKDKLGEYRKTG
jgi:hypothetical protein